MLSYNRITCNKKEVLSEASRCDVCQKGIHNKLSKRVFYKYTFANGQPVCYSLAIKQDLPRRSILIKGHKLSSHLIKIGIQDIF